MKTKIFGVTWSRIYITQRCHLYLSMGKIIIGLTGIALSSFKGLGVSFKFVKTVFAAFVLILVLTVPACKVGENYQQPTLQLPKQFTSVATSDTNSIATLEWKRFFTDTTLQRLITRALIGNFDLQLATKRLAEAEAYVKQARMNYVPAVQAQLSATTTLPSKNSLNGISLKSFLGTNHVEDYSFAVGVSWEADVWGKIRRQKEAALANYLQTYEGARAVQTKLITDIANSYFNLLMLDAQMDVTHRNLALSDTIVRIMQLQKNAGQVTELAVQQAEVQRQKAALIVPQLEQQIVTEENNIRILSGELPAVLQRSAQLRSLSFWDEDMPTGLPAAIVSRRPDVRATEMALVAANANVGIAQANMYPSLNITAAGGLNAFKASKWFVVPTSLFGTAAGALVQPVLQRRQLKTRLEVAQIQRDQAVISFRKSALNAIGEVVNALVSVDKLKTQKQIATSQVDTLQKVIHNAQLLFKSGLADYLEVITAQSNALQAELALADIQRQRLGAMVEVYRALGGGVK